MNILNLDEEKYKDIEVKGAKFRIRAMFPKDKIMITQRRMRLQDGNPVSSLSEDDFYFFESIAINDICIDKMPKDFKTNESCMNWIDNELINLVANEIRKHTSELEEALKKNRPIDGIDKE